MPGYPAAILLLHEIPILVSNIELELLQKVGIVVPGIYYQLLASRHATILRFKIKILSKLVTALQNGDVLCFL
jgi:hypothetical protein